MRHQFMIDEWVTMLILLGAHGCDMLECPQKLERVCVVADVDFTVEEGMDGAACLACAGYGDRVLAVFGQQALKIMAIAASQLSSTCSFGRRSRQQQRDGYNNEFRVAREVFHKIQAQISQILPHAPISVR